MTAGLPLGAGCFRDPVADLEGPTSKPAPETIEGCWVGQVAYASPADQARLGTARSVLVLYPDGRASFKNIPEFLAGKGTELSTGSGTWSFDYSSYADPNGRAWQVSLQYPEKSKRVDMGYMGIGGFLVVNREPPYKLFYMWSDPDLEECAWFVRKGPPSTQPTSASTD